MTKKEKKQEYIVEFVGEAKVKAESYEDARRNVECMSNVQTSRPISTKKAYERFIEICWLNSSGLIQVGLSIILINIWSNIIKFGSTLDDTNNLIILLVSSSFLIVSVKIPKILGRITK